MPDNMNHDLCLQNLFTKLIHLERTKPAWMSTGRWCLGVERLASMDSMVFTASANHTLEKGKPNPLGNNGY